MEREGRLMCWDTAERMWGWWWWWYPGGSRGKREPREKERKEKRLSPHPLVSWINHSWDLLAVSPAVDQRAFIVIAHPRCPGLPSENKPSRDLPAGDAWRLLRLSSITQNKWSQTLPTCIRETGLTMWTPLVFNNTTEKQCEEEHGGNSDHICKNISSLQKYGKDEWWERSSIKIMLLINTISGNRINCQI